MANPPSQREPALTTEDRGYIEAILRDRVGIDRRILEIDARTLELGAELRRLRDEQAALEAERAELYEQRRPISNRAIAGKFGVSESSVRDVIKHRT